MRILLIGATGQLGWELRRSLDPLGEVVVAGSRGPAPAPDFLQPATLAALVERERPDVVVNAVAYTAVDKAEADQEAARLVNAVAPGELAAACARTGALFVHYSTDYVFDGSGNQPRREDDPTGPLNVYGRTKLEGEQLVRSAGAKHLVLRTSWVYASRGGNFARTMLRLAQERDKLTVVHDQVGAPTGADLLADLTAQAIPRVLADPSLAGLYHAVAAGETSWHGYAQFVLREAQQLGVKLKAAPDAVEPVPSSAFPAPARRPANSRLDTGRLRQAFGLHLPRWEPGVARMLREVIPG